MVIISNHTVNNTRNFAFCLKNSPCKLTYFYYVEFFNDCHKRHRENGYSMTSERHSTIEWRLVWHYVSRVDIITATHYIMSNYSLICYRVLNEYKFPKMQILYVNIWLLLYMREYKSISKLIFTCLWQFT